MKKLLITIATPAGRKFEFDMDYRPEYENELRAILRAGGQVRSLEAVVYERKTSKTVWKR